jgi:hypothetical protein
MCTNLDLLARQTGYSGAQYQRSRSHSCPSHYVKRKEGWQRPAAPTPPMTYTPLPAAANPCHFLGLGGLPTAGP